MSPRSLASADPAPTCPSCGTRAPEGTNFCPGCGTDLRGLTGTSDTFAGGQTPSPASAAPPAPGPTLEEVVDGRYRLKEKLGEGGMGSVYKVEHVRMGKIMALKILRAEAAFDPVALKRFHQEARIVSKLSHPNTVAVFDFGELQDGSLYMAMEYVPGRDLASHLRTEGNFSERRAIGIVAQVLRSLGEAHDAGIVHRDIKPANVMLLRTRDGEDVAKVVDFGIAKLAEVMSRAQGPSTEEQKAITGVAEFVGTPNYMSPEQVKGDDLDARSDLYSVGAMLFELLTGRPPFVGNTPMAVAAKHLQETAPKLSEAAPQIAFSPEMEELVARALAKKPSERFRHADAMRAALEAARDPNAKTGTTGKLGPTVMPSVTTGGLEIAGREDWEKFDAFERGLRWRSRLLLPGVLLAGIGLGVGIWRGYLKERLAPVEQPRVAVTAEVEPNDGPNVANLIEPGAPVTGTLPRRDVTVADADYYEFTVPEGPAKHATVDVTGVPNVNLALTLWKKGPALPLAEIDDRFVGGGEALTDLHLDPGTFFVRVTDKKRSGDPESARENSLDRYALTVKLEDAQPEDEQEPDNTLETAMKVGVERPVWGHAGAKGEVSTVTSTRGDVGFVGTLWSDDYFEVALSSGATQACVVVTGVDGATLALGVASTEQPRLRQISDRAEYDRALSEHLGKVLRDKPVRVPQGELGVKCAKAAESVVFRLQVAEGRSDEKYLLVPFDDAESGLAAVSAACESLSASGQSTRAKELADRVLAALPNAKGAPALRELRAKLP